MVEIPSENMSKVNKSLNEITRKLRDSHKTITKSTERAMIIEGNNLRNVIIESMRSTPRMLRSTKSGKSKRHHPSAPGFPPAIDKGELIRSIVYDVENMNLHVGANLGTKVSGDRYYAEILETSKNVNMKRPWLSPAVNANKERILSNITNAVRKDFKGK